MNSSNIFSLLYPRDTGSQHIFHQRVWRFFSYSVSNMLSLILGASLIALVLYIHEAQIKHIALLFFTTSAVAVMVIFISQYVLKAKLEKNLLAVFLQIRVVLGCCIGVLYGLAVFLLPDKNIDVGILFLLSIYLVSIAIAIFQYSIIPTYYISFNLSIFIPLAVGLLNTPNNISSMTLVLLAIGVILFAKKGLKVSQSEIDSIKVNLQLKAEVAEHIITREKLREMALYDNLTKVANRYLFEESATALLSKAHRNKQNVALLYIDLNQFKYINDNFGHDIGDKVLVEATNRIRKNIRSSDLVARIGGDEFVIVLENYHLDKVKVNLIESIQATLNEDIEIDNKVIELRASIGASIYPHDADNLSELLRLADAKMYQQKAVHST